MSDPAGVSGTAGQWTPEGSDPVSLGSQTRGETARTATPKGSDLWPLAALVALLILSGCASKTGPKEAKKPKPAAKAAPATPVGTINLDAGNSTHYGPEPKRERQWYVEWKTGARADLSKRGDSQRVGIDYVTMEGVTGHLFQDGKASSTFRSRTGVGDGERQKLELVGDVHVVSPDLASELTCDRLVYDAVAKVIRAEGHVRVTGKVGTIGNLELWATPDLKLVATPDMFPRQFTTAHPHR